MFQKSEGTYIQLGVASFWWNVGQGCSIGYPSGFTRVSKYVDWVKLTSSSAMALITQSFNLILYTSVTVVVISFL
jgi:secreted trypsin-like serine protease